MEIINEESAMVDSPLQPCAVAVGDEVKYVPHRIHATKKDSQGDYPWRIGRMSKDCSSVIELNGRDLELFLSGVQKMSHVLNLNAGGNPVPSEQQLALNKVIIYIAPRKFWKGVVTAVNDDSTVNLDVHGANSACTLHEKRVPFTQVKPEQPEPHTCHKE